MTDQTVDMWERHAGPSSRTKARLANIVPLDCPTYSHRLFSVTPFAAMLLMATPSTSQVALAVSVMT